MSTKIRFALLAGALVTAAACGQSPTASAVEVEARRAGGFTFGGGRAAGTEEQGATNDPSTTTCAERGGFTFGGGVVGTPDPCEEPQ